MALLTKKDFAARCSLPTKNLATYIGRGQVVVAENDLIDDEDGVNQVFLAKRAALEEKKGATPPTAPQPARKAAKTSRAAAKAPAKAMRPAEKSVGKGAGSEYFELDLQMKRQDLLKKQEDTEFTKLKKEKMQGLLIPSQLLKPVITRHNQNLINAFKQAADEVVRAFAKKKGLSGSELAEMRGEIVRAANEGMKKATAGTVAAVDGIVNEYALARGVGERT